MADQPIKFDPSPLLSPNSVADGEATYIDGVTALSGEELVAKLVEAAGLPIDAAEWQATESLVETARGRVEAAQERYAKGQKLKETQREVAVAIGQEFGESAMSSAQDGLLLYAAQQVNVALTELLEAEQVYALALALEKELAARR